MNRIDWANLMRAGLQGLRLRPADFWDMTPAELRVMLGETGKSGPLLSDGLEALIALYPDDERKT